MNKVMEDRLYVIHDNDVINIIDRSEDVEDISSETTVSDMSHIGSISKLMNLIDDGNGVSLNFLNTQMSVDLDYSELLSLKLLLDAYEFQEKNFAGDYKILTPIK